MRKQVRYVGSATVALAFVLTLLMTPYAAWAEDGSGSGDSSSTSSSSGTGTNDGTETEGGQTSSSQQIDQLRALRDQAAKQRQENLQKEQESEDQGDASQQEQTKKHNQEFQNACKGRLNEFKRRLTAITSLSQKRSQALDTIVQRLDSFVQDNKLTVPNYDTLKAAVSTQAQLVASLQQTLEGLVTNFSCGTSQDEAKASLASFKDAFTQEIKALQDQVSQLNQTVDDLKKQVQANQSGH